MMYFGNDVVFGKMVTKPGQRFFNELKNLFQLSIQPTALPLSAYHFISVKQSSKRSLKGIVAVP